MVDVVVTASESAITWNNTIYTWDSIPSSNTWSSNHLTGHSLVAEYLFTIEESYEKVDTYVRNFSETLPVNDSYDKEVFKEIIETLPLTDKFVQNSLATIYDVALRSAANVDLSKLRTIARQSQIAGYEEGVEFLPGDYEFKDAIVGIVVTNKTTNKKVGFKSIDAYVDTPDIIDRGTIEITNTGDNYDPVTGYTTVYLNKVYHTVPNITASVVSGTDLAEALFDPNGFAVDSFRVKLVVSSPGNTVENTTLVLGGGTTSQTTGTLLWKASGY